MMSSARVFKWVLKTFIWIVGLIMALFILVFLAVQIPAVQNKIIRVATTFVSSKTNTKVEISRVSISLPTSIIINGLYLEDLSGDTLVFAGKAKINASLFGLLSNTINIRSVALEDATVKLHSTKTDPLFNYNFLLTAFADTSSQLVPDTAAKSNWTYNLGRISLKNIRFRYNDEFSGMDVSAALRNSEFSVAGLDMENLAYQLNDLSAEGLAANVLISISPNLQESSSESVSPKLSVKKLKLSNSSVTYTDSVAYRSIVALIDGCKLEDAGLDMQQTVLSANALELSKSKISYHSFAPEIATDSTVSSSENTWKVAINRIKMADNTLIFQSGNKPEPSPVFNSNYLEYNALNLEATGVQYSSDVTKASVETFSATDQNQFAITSFATDFRMDAHSVTVNKLRASTENSSVDADFNLEYSSLTALLDSMQFTKLNLVLRNVSLQNSDVLYFMPELVQQPFFQKRENRTSASGNISGALNKLNGENVQVRTGSQTSLKTDFSINGLPNFATASFDFPQLIVRSGKKDLEWLAGPYIPENMELPEKISLEAMFKGRIKQFDSAADVTSSLGSGKLKASVDPDENFSGQLRITHFDLGRLMNDTVLYGPVSLTAEASGKGLDLNTIRAKFKADVTELYLNQYSYKNLKLDGTALGKQFGGKISMNDENAAFNFDGSANLNPGQESYRFNLNVLDANLNKLRMTENDVRVSFQTGGNLKGGTASLMHGTAGITNLILARDGKKYQLDTLLSASINGTEKNKPKESGGLIELNYSGNASPVALFASLNKHINQYFTLGDSVPQPQESDATSFRFEIQIHHKPILSKALLPDLLEFEPGTISGSFDSRKNELKFQASIQKLVYGSTEVKNFAVDVNSENEALNYKISSAAISNSQIGLNNFLLDGKLANNRLLANLSSTNGKARTLLIRSQLSKEQENYTFTIDPKELYLANNPWNIAADNSIEFGPQGFRIHHFFLGHKQSSIQVASLNDQFNDDLNIAIANLRLEGISRIAVKDSALVKGTVDGNVLLKRVNKSYGLISDIKVDKLEMRNIPIGNFSLKARRLESNKFELNLNLSGPDNDLTVSGYFVPDDEQNTVNLKAEIQSLSMKMIEAFSMGQITGASGTLTGNILAEGPMSAPDVSGELNFRNVFLKPSFLNNRLELKNETIKLKKDGIYFNSFTVIDPKQNVASLSGSVRMKQFSDFSFDLQANAKDFMLFNTTAKDNKYFFGRMIIDGKVNVSGPLSLPVVNARVKMLKGSSFTFAVPEDQLTTDKGEDVVEFSIPQELNAEHAADAKTSALSSGVSGFDLSSVIEIDKEASLRLLMDPASADSLVVKGEAALSFTMDPGGKMSLTGAYNLNEGSYQVSLESVIKKKFDIDAGSTIVWNGDLMDATASINASYTVRASPIDLVADQLSGVSEADKSGYKQTYPFVVILKLRGEILRPEISFEIQLPPEKKGILGGTVNQKLLTLNEDESARNKQAFALLMLGRFIQENPFQTESAFLGTSAIIRSTVSKFLSSQLNQLGMKVIPGMEVNFDVQSYQDYETGTAKGRTQVEIGVRKQLFKDRLSVELGGSVDVEGAHRQNSASDITGDVTMEYKLTPDGRYRLKGFRHNQYEGAIDGQLVETGVGAVFVRDFNKWRKKPPKSKRNNKKALRKK